MNSGALYVDFGEGNEDLEAARLRGKDLADSYNLTRGSEAEERQRLLAELFGDLGPDAFIEPPLHVAYGSHTHIGRDFYANFNLVVVDDAQVTIGDRVLCGPNVTISTAGHPVHPDLRRGGRQFSLPVTIQDDVWIGAQVVLLPGVTIGRGSVVAAGAVVTRDVPAGVVAGGVPCRVLRPINERDAVFTPRQPRPPHEE
ncbi:sugar O-acetyltransferase [Jatrophihabitans sp. YIM 134969]